jgi:signal transduction histidine kinase
MKIKDATFITSVASADKFYKTDKSRGLDKKGVGLGLYLVKNILSLHGESITVSSVEGEFTKFTFSLSLFKNHHKQS